MPLLVSAADDRQVKLWRMNGMVFVHININVCTYVRMYVHLIFDIQHSDNELHLGTLGFTFVYKSFHLFLPLMSCPQWLAPTTTQKKYRFTYQY